MLGKYLYGIIKKQKTKNKKQKMVSFNSLSAVVADTEYKDYTGLPKEQTIKELTRHQQQIEKIMENFGAVLPVKFGTFLKDRDEVKSALEKGYFFLKSSLRRMEDKIELDLVCFWNEQKAAQMAYQKSKRVQNLQEKIAKKEKATLEDKIALGKLVANYLSKKKEKVSSRILKVLKKEAVQSCHHALADVNMLLNQAFLVEKENEERFNHALNKLDSKFADLVNFRLVSPLPPYSFATVVIDALDKEEVEKAKKLLNLDGEVNKDKVKKAYDKLAFNLHPDHGGNPIEFELVTKGYKLLRKFAENGLIGVYLYKWEEP